MHPNPTPRWTRGWRALGAAVALAALAPAHAALVVTGATRSVHADTSRSDPASQSSSAISGNFSASVLSEQPGVPNFASASTDTTIGALAFFGSGQAQIGLSNNTTGQAESFFDVFFTLTADTGFSGSADLSGSGNAPSHAFFDLDRLGVGGGSIVSESDTAPLGAFGGTLLAGDYRLRVRASTASIDPNEGGLADFSFSLSFAGDPPAGVPAPPSLALALMGLAATGALRRRKPGR